MKVRVLFFSQLKEIAGASQSEEEIAERATVADLLANLYARLPRLQMWDENILVGVGVEFVDRNYVLQNGDEVAIMPPVQGG